MSLIRFTVFPALFSALTFSACSQGGSPTGVSFEEGNSEANSGNPENPSALGLEGSGQDQHTVSAGDSPEAVADSAATTVTAPVTPNPDSTVASNPVPASDTVPEVPVPVPADDAVPVVSAPAEPAKEIPKPMSIVDSIVAAVETPLRTPAVPVVDPGSTPLTPVAKPAVAAAITGNPLALPASSVFLNADFEDQSVACWNGNRTVTSANRTGCGPFTSIGFTPFSLTETGIARSGKKAIAITYKKNEEAGGTNVAINTDSVNVRAYYYFEPGFDFGQGIKIGRVSSFNSAKQVNDVDIILEVRSAQGGNQCGVTDMADVGVFFNGAPKGSDWGNVAANMKFERGRWYAVEYQVVMNAPGKSNGAVRLWVDGVQVAQRENMRIRGSLGAEAKLNTVKVGGWYSNGAKGNSCRNPSQPSTLHMDDVAIATSYIGTTQAVTAGNP